MGCHQCSASGIIIANRKSDRSIYAFACQCPSAGCRNLSKRFPVWSHKHENDFDPDFQSGEYRPEPVIRPAVPDVKMKQANDFDEDDIPW